MREATESLMAHGVFEWVDPPEYVQLMPSRYLHKCDQDGVPGRPKPRVVAQGSYEDDNGTDEAAPADTQEFVRLIFPQAANLGLVLKHVDVKAALFLRGFLRIRSHSFEYEPSARDTSGGFRVYQ